MGKYWLKIGLGAALIFCVGFVIISVARRVHTNIHSDHDVGVPLGAFGAYLPFKLDGIKVGTLRSLTIQRSSPKEISGFVIRARVSDSSALEKLRNCHISVSDAPNINERSTFFCIRSDSGFQGFGEFRAEMRFDGGNTVIVQPLMLPDAAVQEFRRQAADSLAPPLADSLAAKLGADVRVQARMLRDSIRADSLEKLAARIRQRVDSIRGKAAVIPPPSGRKP